MEEAELVQRYLRAEFDQLVAALNSIFERQPALAVRMVRSEVELYEKLVRAISHSGEDRSQSDIDALEQLRRDDSD
jgi:hypothetical protein